MSNEYTESPLKAHGVRCFNAPGIHQELADLGHLSNAIVVPSNASVVHLTGQVGRAEDGSIPSDIGDEIRLAFENVEVALKAAGVKEGWRAVYKLFCLISGDIGDEVLAAYSQNVVKFCGSNRPTQTGVPVMSIMWPNARIELTVEAILPN